MLSSKEVCCPSSEEFFYWPPEEMAEYHHWCKPGCVESNKADKSTQPDMNINNLNTNKTISFNP